MSGFTPPAARDVQHAHAGRTESATRRDLGRAGHDANLSLYVLGYMADNAAMVTTAVAALGSRKLTERAGRRLKLVSGVVMLVLGAVLLLRPQGLL